MSPAIRVTVWNEHVHERRDEPVASIYPHGIHTAIADGLRARLEDTATIRTATLADPDHGLSQALLHDTDVLVWWGHVAHREVADEAVTRVHEHVLAGMGLVTLHSAHLSKIFVRLMGTTCNLQWGSTTSPVSKRCSPTPCAGPTTPLRRPSRTAEHRRGPRFAIGVVWRPTSRAVG